MDQTKAKTKLYTAIAALVQNSLTRLRCRRIRAHYSSVLQQRRRTRLSKLGDSWVSVHGQRGCLYTRGHPQVITLGRFTGSWRVSRPLDAGTVLRVRQACRTKRGVPTDVVAADQQRHCPGRPTPRSRSHIGTLHRSGASGAGTFASRVGATLTCAHVLALLLPGHPKHAKPHPRQQKAAFGAVRLPRPSTAYGLPVS